MKVRITNGSAWYSDKNGEIIEVSGNIYELGEYKYHRRLDDETYLILFDECEIVKDEPDITIIYPSTKIEKVVIPTQISDSEGYVLTQSLGVVEIRDDVEESADVLGVHIKDIPLLIKGLEALYDEYMDAQSK